MKSKTIWEKKGLFRVFNNSVDSNELLQEQESVFSDPRFDDLYYQLSDFTDVYEVHLSLDDISKLAAYAKAAALSNPRIINAVVSRDETQLAMISWYQTQTLEWRKLLLRIGFPSAEVNTRASGSSST